MAACRPAPPVALHPGHLTRNLQAQLRRLGLPAVGVHGLRHTAATLRLNSGVGVHLVANRLGHTDASTTLSVYVHVMPDDDQKAAATIADVLFADDAIDDTGSDAMHPADTRGHAHPAPSHGNT